MLSSGLVTASGAAAELVAAGRAFSERTFRESYHPYCNGYGDSSASSVQTLRTNGTAQLPSSTSTPCFLGCGSRLLPRRFSQQLTGPQTSPTALQRDLDLVEERTTRGPLTYVMLPLDTVNAEGIFRYAGSAWFSQALQLLVASGAHGVAMDFWWGAVERSPGQYNWAGYKQALEVIKQTGLKVQAVLSFHACGGNVGDTVQIPLPEWVLQCGEADPDLFFADRPRNGGLGNRNREYLSIWADDAPGVLRGRSPLQCYEDFMVSLRENFSQELGTVIDEIVIGAGPCGELRLPSYVEANGWRFPGAGEFQCYDRRALASLAQAAREAGHPEWGYTGPHDAGEYNSTPEHTGFFSHNGSWNTPYGRFFLDWYSTCLLRHGERLLAVANQVFAVRLWSHQAAAAAAASLQQQHYSSGGGSGSGLGFATLGGMPQHHGGGAPSQSHPFQFLHHQGSSGRISTMSLNRILETGGGGGVESGSSQDCVLMRPPSVPPPARRQADGAASLSPSCTCSSISTCTTSSSSVTGSIGAVSLAGSHHQLYATAAAVNGGAGAQGSGGLMLQQSVGGGGGAGSMRVGTLAGRTSSGGGGGGSGGGGNSMSDPGGGGFATGLVGAVLDRRASVVAACTATELLRVPEPVGVAGGGKVRIGGDIVGGAAPGMRDASSGSSTLGGGGGQLGSGGSGDTAMIDVEPSDASHTSTDATRDPLLPGPPGSSSGHCSEPLLCQAPSASALLPSGAPSPLAAGDFRSSASTLLADAEPLYGQGTAFAAAAVAAAAGVILASGGTARMDLCPSLSSLTTEYHCSGGGVSGGGGGMLFMDVAASLVADGDDDESDVGTTSCGTGVPGEEADELFAMAATHMLGQGGTATTAMSSYGDDGSRGSADLAAMGMGLALGAGIGVAAHAMPPLAATAPPGVQLGSPTASGSGGVAAAVAAGGGGGGYAAAAAAAGGGGGSGGAGLHLALKIAGIHWWYRSRSHAAELTAGYYNVEGRDGYAPIVELCARHRANLVLTCVEMCDAQHPAAAQCGPEGLLRQLRNLAARSGVALSGENALPIFSTGGVDTDALDRIVTNVRPWPAGANAAGSSASGCSGRGVISPAPSQALPYLTTATTATIPTLTLHNTQSYWQPQQQQQQLQFQHQYQFLHPQQQQQQQSAFSYPAAAATAAAVAGGGNNIVGLSYRMSESGRAIPMLYSGAATAQVQDAHPQGQALAAAATGLWSYPSLDSQLSTGGGHVACPSPVSAAGGAAAGGQPDVLPPLRAFTFLRLVPEMLLPGYQGLWMRFMTKLMTTSAP